MAAQIINLGNGNYEILTDASIETINDVSLYIWMRWIDFAEGKISLNGEKIKDPTGDYASLIERHSQGQLGSNITTSNPEPGKANLPLIIELGHKAYDMKRSDVFFGKSWPMHRGARVYTGHSPKVPQSRKGDAGWIIPEMKGMHPAKTLAELAKNMLS